MKKILARAAVFVTLLAVATGINAAPKMDAEVVEMRADGFWPTSIARKTGPVLLVFLSRSVNARDFSLELTVEGGKKVIEPVNFRENSQDIEANLSAGTYYIADSLHPKWAPLTITVK